jgi:hypothetical protein
MRLRGVIPRTESLKTLSCHPMLLPTVIVENNIQLNIEKVDRTDKRLDGIEEATGMHTFAWRPRGDPFASDLVEINRCLSSCATTLAVIEMRIQELLDHFQMILKYNEYIAENSAKQHQESLRRAVEILGGRIETSSSVCRGLLLRVQYNQKRTATQLAVVGTLATN